MKAVAVIVDGGGFSQDKALASSAIKAMSKAEMDVLMGIGPDGSPTPALLHANPDFHDGQVLIDEANKVVTILDFGQAVAISNAEREFAVGLLRITSKIDSPRKVVSLLGKSSAVTEEDIAEIFKRTDRMDIFVNLLSLLERKGMTVPIASVHWVLAANRQIELGNKIGVGNLKSFKHRVLFDKLGLGQGMYNRRYLLKGKVFKIGAALLPGRRAAP